MRKSVIPASLVTVALLTGASFAAAAATSATGKIKTLDMATHTLTLANGQAFTVPANWDGSKFKVGEKVKITYMKKGAAMEASKVVAVK